MSNLREAQGVKLYPSHQEAKITTSQHAYGSMGFQHKVAKYAL